MNASRFDAASRSEGQEGGGSTPPGEPHGPGHSHGHDGHHGGHHGHGHGHGPGPELQRLLELDAVFHAGMLDEAMRVVAELMETTTPVREAQRALDIGAGTGTGSVALARTFPQAQVIAVDVSASMLERVRDHAQENGLADRIETVELDISRESETSSPGGSEPELGLADVAWASMSLHEVSHPERALRRLHASLRPGGVLAVVEMNEPPLVLPKEYAEFEARIRPTGMTPATDHPEWSSMIEAAGFESVNTLQLQTDVTLPADGLAREYAALELGRVAQSGVALSPDDQRLLDALTGDGAGSVNNLDSVWIRGSRTLWVARR